MFYKNFYDVEQYVYDIDIGKFRRILASFRSGAHCLSMAQQQYQLAEHEFLCPCCEIYIEDEFHFIFICPLYNCIREQYLQQAM